MVSSHRGNRHQTLNRSVYHPLFWIAGLLPLVGLLVAAGLGMSSAEPRGDMEAMRLMALGRPEAGGPARPASPAPSPSALPVPGMRAAQVHAIPLPREEAPGPAAEAGVGISGGSVTASPASPTTTSDSGEARADPEQASDVPAEQGNSQGFTEAARHTFGGRPIRKAREITMTVTAYSPDARSCGDSADGITASGYSVWTNGMKLVAADTDVLPMGSVVTIPGYHDGNPVPVLDRGGAIQGKRLDVLYPTHDRARQWGVKKVTVTVWEYAD